jgi:protocatechuate 3,4-dioxygenase beta subunit
MVAQEKSGWFGCMLAAREQSTAWRTTYPSPTAAGQPPHIHVRVSAPGYEELVTQHYPERGQRKANFDLVLVAE